MRDFVEAVLVNVESVTARSVAEHGDQVELQIKMKRGDLTLRLLASNGRVIRVTDLRKRDRKKAVTPKIRVPWVPMPAVQARDILNAFDRGRGIA